MKLKTDEKTIKIEVPTPAKLDGKTLNEKQMNAAHQVARYLSDAFEWEESPEGINFWSSVYDRLKQLGNRGY